MYLHRIFLDARCREARRDLAEPYELHSTLCRAFSSRDTKCPQGEFLWRMEPENMTVGSPRILIQSRSLPDWSRIGIKGWLKREPDPAIDIDERLGLGAIRSGQKFRFRLRANPSVCRGGKRLGLMKTPEQEKWLFRKGKDYHGFDLPSLKRVDDEEEGQVLRLGVAISQEQILRSKKRGNDHEICVFSVLYDGTLIVSDPEKFRSAVLGGIGHGKAMGLGLLSVASAG